MSNESTHPVVGHHAGWGMTSAKNRPQPYKLTAGASDTMCVKVREKIDILGVGTDVVVMDGTFTVRRDHPCPVGEELKWGESCIKTEFRSLELYGESPIFGTVRVHLDPSHSSHGEVGPAESGSLAASCVAHCFPTIELPDLGMKLTTAGQAVRLASKVVQIPPVGDVARSDNSAPLVDEFNNRVGEIVSSDIEVGEVICSIPLGATGPRDAVAHDHSAHSHPEPSGPAFYAAAPSEHVTAGAAPPHQHPSQAAPDISEILNRLETDLRSLTEAIKKMAGK